MQVIRTVVWIVVTAILVAFLFMNWGEPVAVNYWPIETGYVHFEWPVGVVALFFFFLGLLPMWLLARAGRWRLHRRINSLENTVRANSIAPSATETEPTAQLPDPPADTTTESDQGKTTL